MLAIRAHAFGGPGVMRLDELPTPEPGPGQARVRVVAAGVNYTDISHRVGNHGGTPPIGLGREGAGLVEALGPDTSASGLAVGQRVAWTGVDGSYASHHLVPVDQLVALPDALSFEQGAAVMLQGMTAHYLTSSVYPLQPGDTCLVHAAAGGLGLLLCQQARRRGARVIGTVSTEAKERLAREAGADEVIRYTEVDFEPEVRRLTDGRGVQAIYDGVGRDTFARGFRCLARRGVLALYGQASGPVEPLDSRVLLQGGSLFLTRPTLHDYVATRAELEARANDVLGWVADGSLKLRIERIYPLAEAAEAHRALASRATTGKLLLIPSA